MPDSPHWPVTPAGYTPGAVQIDVDDEAGMAYILISDTGVTRTSERVHDRVLVDYDKDGNTVGVEVMLASRDQKAYFSHRKWRLATKRWWWSRR